MNDYIKRSDAIKTVCGDCEYYSTNDCEDCRLDRLKKIPASDVQPVVYCKDCKWYMESKVLAPNRFCYRLEDVNGNNIGYNFAPNDFCSYGERRGAKMGGTDGRKE